MVVYRFKNWGERFHLRPSRGIAEGGVRGERDGTIATPVEGFFLVYMIIFIPRRMYLPLIPTDHRSSSIASVNMPGNAS